MNLISWQKASSPFIHQCAAGGHEHFKHIFSLSLFFYFRFHRNMSFWLEPRRVAARARARSVLGWGILPDSPSILCWSWWILPGPRLLGVKCQVHEGPGLKKVHLWWRDSVMMMMMMSVKMALLLLYSCYAIGSTTHLLMLFTSFRCSEGHTKHISTQ